MDRKVYDKCLEVIEHYDSYTSKPSQCILDLVDSCKELEYLPDNYLHRVYWPEFQGDAIGFTVEEGYLLYRYSIGDYEKFVVSKSLTSTVVRHLDKYYLNTTEAFNAIPQLKEKLKKLGVYNGIKQ